MATKATTRLSQLPGQVARSSRNKGSIYVVFVVVSGILLLETAPLVAQEETGNKEERGAAARSGREARGSSRGRFNSWLEQMSQAYEANDREEMGELLEQMKQRRQRRPNRDRAAPAPARPPRQRQARALSPLTAKEREKEILAVLDDMHQNQRRGMMNVSPDDGRMLRLLTESIRARRVVEIGTSNDYSGIWFCLALRHTGGQLITHEINADRANLARENFKRAGVQQLVNLVEGDAHETVKNIKGPIDILFLDADKAGYPDYLDKLLPQVRPGGLILAHNTSSHGDDAGMQNYIKLVSENPGLETLFIHRQAAGIGITLKKR